MKWSWRAGEFLGIRMIIDFRHLSPGDSLSRAVELVLSGSQQDFPVVDGQRIVGILPRTELILALAQHGQEKPVGELMVRAFESACVADTLQSAHERLQGVLAPALPVTRNGQLTGMITAENVNEYPMIRGALGLSVNAIAGSAWLPHSIQESASRPVPRGSDGLWGPA